MTPEIKKLLPPEGARWLFVRAEIKEVSYGRKDAEMMIFDENIELVALSHPVYLVIENLQVWKPADKTRKAKLLIYCDWPINHFLSDIHSPLLSATATFLAIIRVISISHVLEAGSWPCLIASRISLIWAPSDSSCLTSETDLVGSAAPVALLDNAVPRRAILPSEIASLFMA